MAPVGGVDRSPDTRGVRELLLVVQAGVAHLSSRHRVNAGTAQFPEESLGRGVVIAINRAKGHLMRAAF